MSDEIKPPGKVSVDKDDSHVDTDPVETPEVDSPKDEGPEDKAEEVWGLRPTALPPEESPLDQNGYAGVDPDYQREPLA